ncbi:MAG TPA: crosslink repair DNA glycosylase YcaQ family protein [Anaerolineales bacterium]
MTSIPYELLLSYRNETYRLLPGKRISNRDEAVEFVNQRGFIYFWPIRDTLLPSLWTAVAGDRPVADAHDDPGHVTWGWKDSLIGKNEWYYAKVLRRKATIISMNIAPYFYALSENYGSPEDDYLILYEQGHLTQEAKAVYQAILENGPLDTIALRRAARLSSRESDSRFNKALADLQAGFLLVPVAVTQAGAWRYAFAYDIVARHHPEIVEKARYIGELDARRKLVELYFRSVGGAQLRDVNMLFRWKPADVSSTIDYWVENQLICRVEIEGQSGEWLILQDLFLEHRE